MGWPSKDPADYREGGRDARRGHTVVGPRSSYVLSGLRNARAVLHVVLAVAVTGVAGYLSRSPALTFLLGFVALHTMAMEIAYPPREGRPERGPRYRVVLGFALLGVVAWAICRAAQSAWGEQVGPGVACLLIIWTSEIRHRVAGREQD